MKRFFLVAVFVGVAAGAAGQTAGKIPIYVSSTTPDNVGTTYAYQLREALRLSAGYELTPYQDSEFVVRIVSIDPTSDNTGRSTVIALALTVYNPNGPDYYLTQWVILAGRSQVATSVADMIADIDKSVRTFLGK